MELPIRDSASAKISLGVGTLELKQLGATGVMLPEIGLGTWKYTGGVGPLRRGIALGANLVDTAEMYRNEAEVGEAIAPVRDHVFLATKVLGSHLRHDQVLRAAEESLRKLTVDQIDLYQVHWPNNRVPIAETMRAMEELADRGMVRYIGVSNFSLPQLKEAQAAMTRYPIVSNQVLYSLKARRIEAQLLPYCQDNNVTIIAYTPLADGSLAVKSRLRPDRRFRALEQVGAEVDKTPAQVALNWVTSHPSVITIPKTNSITRTEENCAASGWRLSPGQIQWLDEAYAI